MAASLKLVEGGAPQPAAAALPYGRHSIDDEDVEAVVAALRSPLLAHGPRAGAFERAFAARTGAAEAVACSSGTAALHLALHALGVEAGSGVIVPAVTFLATATAARLCGAEVTFADVDADSGLMTAATLSAALRRAQRPVRAVLPVHLGGRLAEVAALRPLADAAGAVVVEDSCHAVGGFDAAGAGVGACPHSHAATFSLHPVKTIAAGEGGMVTTPDPALAARLRRLTNQGVTRDPALFSDPALSLDDRGDPNPWSYEQLELGFNYRMSELQAALGMSQLAKLDRFMARRRRLAALYAERLRPLAPTVRLAPEDPRDVTCPHLLQVLIDFDAAGLSRAEVMRRLAAHGVGTQVHYIPVYRQPYFRARYGPQLLSGAERFYARTLTLPLFPDMADADVDRVVEALWQALDLG